MDGDEIGFADYLRHLRGRSAATAEAYRHDVDAFLAYCEKLELPVAESLTRARVSLYLLERGGTVTTRSCARAVSALKAYAQYLAFTCQLGASAIEDLRPPKYSRQLPPYLSADEVIRIVTAYDAEAESAGMRNAAILHLLYAAGLRVGECATLRLGSVRLAERIVKVMGKGRRERESPFGQRAADALERYIANARTSLSGEKSSDWLWLNRRGGRLTARSMRRILDAATLLAGSIKPISPHKLRHACATHMLEGGADVRLLQELLGHQSINTTQIYTQITRAKLLEAYEQTHPRAGK